MSEETVTCTLVGGPLEGFKLCKTVSELREGFTLHWRDHDYEPVFAEGEWSLQYVGEVR